MAVAAGIGMLNACAGTVNVNQPNTTVAVGGNGTTALPTGSAPSPTSPPMPTPRPTQGPVHYDGTGGRGLFGPFYLDAGIHRVKYAFKAEAHGEYEYRRFDAYLVGTKGSGFSGATIVNFTTSILTPSKDSVDDFNNIQAPYSGSYFIEILNAEGDWQIDISLVTPSEIPGLFEYNNGVVLYGAGDLAGAEEQFRFAIQKNADLAEAYLNLGQVYLELGRLDDARRKTSTALAIIQRIKKTVAQGSTVAQIESLCHNNLGAISSHEGNRLDAKKEFEEALRLDPNNELARANLKKLGI